jgi:hypothetical protein
MNRERPNAPTSGRPRRTRSGAPAAVDTATTRTRRRGAASVTAAPDLSEEEVRALLDDNVDPDEVERVARDAQDDEQEASDHDRDTTRDRLESLLLEQDDDF